MSPLDARLQLPAKVGVDLEHAGRHGTVSNMRREDPHHSFGQPEGNRYSRDQKECGGKKPSHPALPPFCGLDLPQGVRVRRVEHQLAVDDHLAIPRQNYRALRRESVEIRFVRPGLEFNRRAHLARAGVDDRADR